MEHDGRRGVQSGEAKPISIIVSLIDEFMQCTNINLYSAVNCMHVIHISKENSY